MNPIGALFALIVTAILITTGLVYSDNQDLRVDLANRDDKIDTLENRIENRDNYIEDLRDDLLRKCQVFYSVHTREVVRRGRHQPSIKVFFFSDFMLYEAKISGPSVKFIEKRFGRLERREFHRRARHQAQRFVKNNYPRILENEVLDMYSARKRAA